MSPAQPWVGGCALPKLIGPSTSSSQTGQASLRTMLTCTTVHTQWVIMHDSQSAPASCSICVSCVIVWWNSMTLEVLCARNAGHLARVRGHKANRPSATRTSKLLRCAVVLQLNNKHNSQCGPITTNEATQRRSHV
jgi:hypothetical protein